MIIDNNSTNNTSLNIQAFEQRYLIQKIIGHGSFGKVYAGLDIVSNKLVALKVERAKNSPALLKEAQILKQFHQVTGIP